MDLVTWDKSYSVNVECCDAEHRKLFSLINALHEAMMSGKSRAIIAGTVHELEKYTQTHFLAEEALMQQAQYPKLNEHRGEHQKFVAQVKQFRHDLETGGTCDPNAVVMFVKDWLAGHIMQTDKVYASHLNSHGIH
jgi:hemerythrin-like metal-binding protein